MTFSYHAWKSLEELLGDFGQCQDRGWRPRHLDETNFDVLQKFGKYSIAAEGVECCMLCDNRPQVTKDLSPRTSPRFQFEFRQLVICYGSLFSSTSRVKI